MHLVKQRAHEFGVRGVNPDDISFDLAAAMHRKNKIVDGIVTGIYKNLKRNKNITFLAGRAEFSSPVDIRVDDIRITAEKSILAIGAQPAFVKIPGLDEAGFITNYEALQLETIPASMIIIGAGYIGVEFAQMYARFGTEVTMFGRSPRIMVKEEPELSDMLAEILQSEVIDMHLSADVIAAGRQNDKRFVVARKDENEHRYEADVILVAIGRSARVDGLGLDQAGVDLDGAYIKTDQHLLTTSSNIWSLGDANGGAMFTHRATYDGPIAALNAIKEINRSVDYQIVPRAIFTEPALASVGLTEKEARQAGHEVKIGKAWFKHSGRAKALEQREGLVKVVVDDESKEILGAHILGAHADMLIHQVVTAMHNHGTIEPITKSIHIHPTLSELVKDAAKAAR